MNVFLQNLVDSNVNLDDYYRTKFNVVRIDKADNDLQKMGVDKIIYTPEREIYIEEKIRSKDYGDILFEKWSIIEHQKPGWINKGVADYLVYFTPRPVILMLPFPLLRLVWNKWGEEWERVYGSKVAKTRGIYEEYHSVNVAVPEDVVFRELFWEISGRPRA